MRAAAALAAMVALPGCGGEKPDPGTEGAEAVHAEPHGSSPLARRLGRPAGDSSAVDAALSTLRSAGELLEEGRPRAADDSLAAAARPLGPAADWIRLGRARAAAVAGDTSRVRRLLAGLEPAPPRRHAAAVRVTARDSAGDPAGAARILLARAEEATAAEEGGRALLRAARLLAEAGDSAGARQALRRAARAAPGGEAARKAARELTDRGDLTAEEQRAVGRTLAARGLWWRAHPRFRRYLSQSDVVGPGRDSARLEYGRSLLGAGRYPAAVEVARSVAAGTAGLAAEARLLEGRARLRHRGPGDGVELLEELVRRHPEHPAAGEALAELALRAERRGKLGAARRYWADAARHSGSAREAERRLLRSGTAAYLDGRFDSAAALLGRSGRAAGAPDLRQRGVYWAGLAHRAAGEGRRGRELLRACVRLDPYSYYGTRAAELLGRPLLPADLPSGPPRSKGLDSELTNAVLRLRVADLLRLEGAVGAETERLEEHFVRHRNGLYALAEAVTRGGFPVRGVRLGLRARAEAEGTDLRLLRILYPLPHREAIGRAARRQGLSPYLVAGVVRRESLFDSDAESRAGAVGLMQLMPGTGRDLARRRGAGELARGDLLRPSVNLNLGTAYLSELLDRFDGSLPSALAAYNAGPSRVSRWRRRPYAGDADVFLERIPFRETRGYVKGVLSDSRVYAALYGCGRSEPCVGRKAAFSPGPAGEPSAPRAVR